MCRNPSQPIRLFNSELTGIPDQRFPLSQGSSYRQNRNLIDNVWNLVAGNDRSMQTSPFDPDFTAGLPMFGILHYLSNVAAHSQHNPSNTSAPLIQTYI